MKFALWLEDALHAETLSEQLKWYYPSSEIRKLNFLDELSEDKVNVQKEGVYFIQMSNDKMPMLEQLLDCVELPGLVFVLAENGELSRHMDIASLDYLQWPWTMNDFKSLMQRLSDMEDLKQEYDTFSDGYKSALSFFISTVHNGLNGEIILPEVRGYKPFHTKSLMCLESDGPYTHVFTDEGHQLLTNRPLKHFDDVLDPAIFIRIQSSQIINMNFMKDWKMEQGLLVTMNDGSERKVSLRWVPLFINAVNNRSKNKVD